MRNVKAVKKIHHSKTKVKGSVDSTPTRKQGESHTLLAQAEGGKSSCASGKGSTRTTASLLPAPGPRDEGAAAPVVTEARG